MTTPPPAGPTAERVVPFSCGAQYLDWQARNCMRCVKYDEENASPEACELDYAIGIAYIGTGQVTEEIARRAGVFDHEGHYTWDCSERVLRDTRRGGNMRRFTLYRHDITPGTERFPSQAYNNPSTPQVEGVVFSDGRVACRWLTAFRSTVAWDSFADFEAIHGHPEYGTEIVWHDAPPDEEGK